MGKKKGQENPKSEEPKEGCNLLGKPKFKKLENGRFKCVETGHELPAHAREAYAVSKHCRLGLIMPSLAANLRSICSTRTPFPRNLSPRNKFRAGWRQIRMMIKSSKKKENEDGSLNKKKDENEDVSLKKEKNKKEEKNVDEIVNEVRDSACKSSDTEDEDDFWMPLEGERWDQDDGGD
ncbi:hypothetical protein SASPL_151978 [Salvia splendens]|uniref:Uncharacterized protein n=1 Tax=Salvia splendens TaxID=180675 RepID=A0A8X8Z0H2_SALSN|nr:hypothetical protein SASPL_151978 [Salvia splendens]